MRVVLEPVVNAVLDQLAGIEPRRVLRFSEAEKKALRRAEEIAEQARDLWRQSVDYDVEGESLDTELAMIGCAVTEIVDGIEISA